MRKERSEEGGERLSTLSASQQLDFTETLHVNFSFELEYMSLKGLQARNLLNLFLRDTSEGFGKKRKR